MPETVESLTIALAGKESDQIPLASFAKVVTNTLGMLKDLDEQGTLLWRVSDVSLKSPLQMTVAAEPRVPQWNRHVVDDYMKIFRSRASRSAMPRGPRIDRALRKAKQIIKVLDDGVGEIAISAPNRETVFAVSSVEVQTATPAEVLFVPSDYQDYVQLEGIIEIAKNRLGKRVTLVDQLTRHETDCGLADDQWALALELMKQQDAPRVAVYGKARYLNDKPISMRVESLTPLTPTTIDVVNAVRGIDITGGMDSVAYIRSLRDAR